MRYLMLVLLFAPFFFGFNVNKQQVKPIRVAVVDTGLNTQDPRFKELLCPEIGEDFTGEGLNDVHGHGTHVVGLIKKYAGNANYCLIILKYYVATAPGSVNSRQYLAAMDALYKFHPDVVNYSGDGPVAMPEEKAIISNLPNVKFFVAAGNDNEDLDKVCDVYPACYAKTLKNITVVGNTDTGNSNYGSVVGLFRDGNNVESDYPFSLNSTGRAVLSGSSMSTARATGEYLHERY